MTDSVFSSRGWLGLGVGVAVMLAAFAGSPSAEVAPSTVERVDALLEARWKKDGIAPAADADDGEFIRRVTLDLIGRVPTTAEVDAFTREGSADKRSRYVDALLVSADYADHWANVYMDTLLGREFRLGYRRAKPVAAYFRHVFETNLPYDRFVRDLLTATGPADGNPATSFIGSRMFYGQTVEQVAGSAASLFLGVQIQCAQCHDHPYVSRFKQQDFVNFTAFFGQTVTKRVDKKWQIDSRIIPMRAKTRPNFKKRLAKKPALIYAVTEPRFFDRDVAQQAGESRRQWLARAITDTDSFAQVTVNRLWAQLFGRGIVTPLEDLGYVGKTDHPALLVELARSFRDSGYDHAALLKSIVLTRAYQRTSRGSGDPQRIEADESAFARAAVRPLSADQLFNSIVTATDLASAANVRLRRRTVEQARFRTLRKFLAVFDDDEGGVSESFSGNVPQGLLLLNGKLTNLSTQGAKGTTLARVLENPDRDARISALYMATYARQPTAAERAALAKLANDKTSFQNLFHALLTSTEFITNH